MTSENEVLQRARTQISENNLASAEQTLLQGIADFPPNIELYNSLMELYFRGNMFDKVAAYFKETTIKFPAIDLNSYFMISQHLLAKNALKECELILYLALQNHPAHSQLTANKLLELYLHPSVPGIVAFNFIKDNYTQINLSTEICQELSRRLSSENNEKEHRDFFIFLYNVSAGNTLQKELFIKQYVTEVKSAEKSRAAFDCIIAGSPIIEPAIFITFAAALLEQAETEEAKKVLTAASTKYPEDTAIFDTAQRMIAEAKKPESITKELIAEITAAQFSKILGYIRECEFAQAADYIKLRYPAITSSKQPQLDYLLLSQLTVCLYYERVLKNADKEDLLAATRKEEIIGKVPASTDITIEITQLIDALRAYYESIIYPARDAWSALSFANTSKPISEPIIGILHNEPYVKRMTNLRSFNNKYGLYDEEGRLVPETFHFSLKGTQLKPCDADFNSTVKLYIEPAEYKELDEPVLFLGYTFHGHHYGHFLVDGLNCAWYLAENEWKGKIYFQFLVDNAISGFFGYEFFRPLALELLELAGIDKSQLILANHDIKFKEVVIPEAGYRNNSYAYRSYTKIFSKIAAAALSKPVTEKVFAAADKTKIYLSRSRLTDDRRLIIGEEVLEKYLADNGFTILHPQELSVTEQIQIFNKSAVIVGTMGSAMHTVLFCKNAPSVHTLCPGNVNMNYTLTNTLAGITEQYYYDVLKTVSTATPLQSGYHAPNYFDIEETVRSLTANGIIAKDYQTTHTNQDIEKMVKEYIDEKSAPVITRPAPQPQRRILFHHGQLINKLLKHYGWNDYLEIGLDKGINFEDILAANKVGVDPVIAFERKIENSRIFNMTSDDFFAQNTETFDIIYIDGMHLYEYAFRDLMNALKCINPGGIIIMHDHMPLNKDCAARERTTSAWTGDVWKVAYDLHRDSPELDYFVINTDFGINVIRKRDPHGLVNYRDPSPDILNLDFSVFEQEGSKFMHLIRPADIAKYLPIDPFV